VGGGAGTEDLCKQKISWDRKAAPTRLCCGKWDSVTIVCRIHFYYLHGYTTFLYFRAYMDCTYCTVAFMAPVFSHCHGGRLVEVVTEVGNWIASEVRTHGSTGLRPLALMLGNCLLRHQGIVSFRMSCRSVICRCFIRSQFNWQKMLTGFSALGSSLCVMAERRWGYI
jgi:hypothetical protein